MVVQPPLPPAEDLTRLRAKYPEGLICTSPLPCTHRVIATTRAGYSKSNITEEHRRTYVCAECRYDAVERARIAAGKAEKARKAGESARAARRLQKLAEQPTWAAARTPRIGRLDVRKNIDVVALNPIYIERPRHGGQRAGAGRSRIHSTDTARRTAAQRAWRARSTRMARQVDEDHHACRD
jgi:hypothetical protein